MANMMESLGKEERLSTKEEKPCLDISKTRSKMIKLGLEMAQTLNLSLDTSIPTKTEKGFRIHTITPFGLKGLKGQGRGLLNQTSILTRVVNPTNLLWLKAGNRLQKWLESQGTKSCPALPIF